MTYHGRLSGGLSPSGRGDVVWIAHGQKSIYRAILVPTDRVDNGVPRERSIARVREKWGVQKSQETILDPRIGRLQEGCIKIRKDGM